MKNDLQFSNILGTGARWLRSTFGRAATGFAALTTLAILLWPKKDWHVEPDKLSAFVVALLAWLGSLVPDRPQSKHDMQLFAQFQAIAKPAWVNWLRRHNFGGSFNIDRMNPLSEIEGDWEGAAYTFDDPILQAAFAPLIDQISDFAHTLALNTWPIHGASRQTACPDGEPTFDEEPHVWERVKKLNDGASFLAKAIDEFILLGRRRLNQAPPAAGAP